MSKFRTQVGTTQEGHATLGEILSPSEQQKLRRTVLRTQKGASFYRRLEWGIEQRPAAALAVFFVVGTLIGALVTRSRR